MGETDLPLIKFWWSYRIDNGQEHTATMMAAQLSSIHTDAYEVPGMHPEPAPYQQTPHVTDIAITLT